MFTEKIIDLTVCLQRLQPPFADRSYLIKKNKTGQILKKTAKFITLVQNSYMLTLLIFPQYSKKKIPDVNHRYLFPIYGSISKSVKTRYLCTVKTKKV